MNRLICLVAVVGVVSGQRWGNTAGDGWRDESQGYRQPVVPAPLAHDGRVIDTPEIQQAKAAHFAAHDAALRANPPKPYNGDYRAPEYNRADDYERRQEYNRPPQQYREPQDYRIPQESNRVNEDYEAYEEKREEPRWRGPLAKIEFTQDGKFIKETPEVAHARAQHLAALQAAKSKPGYQPEEPPRYASDERPEQRREPVDDGQYREDPRQSGSSWQGNQGNQYNTGRGYDVYDNGGEGAQYARNNWQAPGVAKTLNTYY